MPSPSKAWIKASDLGAFVAPPNSNEGLRKVDNQILRISSRKYYRSCALGE